MMFSALTLISFYYIISPETVIPMDNDTSAEKETKLKENRRAVDFFRDRDNLVNVLSVVAALPPPVPPSPQCEAPPVSPPARCDDPGLGELMVTPRHLVTMILFSVEVDTLEIALKEMMDIVDVIFLVEATKSHKGVCIFFYLKLFYKKLFLETKASDVGEDKIHGTF